MPVTRILTSEAQGPTGQSFRQLELGAPTRLDSRLSETQEAEQAQSGAGFTDLVKGFISDVNSIQNRKDRAIDGFVAGEITDVHQVMVAVQEAGLALDLLIEIRNRTQEAFQEIRRLQV